MYFKCLNQETCGYVEYRQLHFRAPETKNYARKVGKYWIVFVTSLNETTIYEISIVDNTRYSSFITTMSIELPINITQERLEKLIQTGNLLK